MSSDFEAVSYEQLFEVKEVVDTLIPGYYRVAVNPFEALENQQGNCFTNAVVGAVALQEIFGAQASMVWSSRFHGNSLGTSRTGEEQLNIHHIDLVVPRNVTRYDILRLAYGMQVADGKKGDVFIKLDRGGIIEHYNFDDQVKPYDEDVTRFGENDDPLLEIAAEGEIVPTKYGKELGLECMDWQHAADQYLAVLGLPDLDYPLLEDLFWSKYQAMLDLHMTIVELQSQGICEDLAKEMVFKSKNPDEYGI